MQNNKFIFQEQQKIAIKLSNALDLSLDEFKAQNLNSNLKLKDAFTKNPKFIHNPVLPKAEIIYEKEFHFLNESLLRKEQRKLRKETRRKERELAAEEEQKEDLPVVEVTLLKSEEKDKVAITMSNQAEEVAAKKKGQLKDVPI